MYRSGLVSRRMALFGVIGGPLLAASGTPCTRDHPEGGAVQGIATLPEVIWEAFLGLWLTFKGFKAAAPILASHDRDEAMAPAYARPDRRGRSWPPGPLLSAGSHLRFRVPN